MSRFPRPNTSGTAFAKTPPAHAAAPVMRISPINRARLALLAAIALAAAFLLSASRVQAQFIPSVGLHGYLNESVDFGAETPVDQIELEGRSGFHVGFDVRTSKKMLYLQPGLHYYRTKTDVVNLREVGVPSDFGEQRHAALKIPALAGLRLGVNKLAAVHLQGGPIATVRLKERLTSDLGGMRDLSFGMAAGVAVDLLSFNVHARYEWGLTPAFEHQAGNADVLMVGVGLAF